MDTALLQQLLSSVGLVKQFYFYPMIDSTMDQARRLLARGGGQHGVLILADFQESGRGRHGRTWEGEAGQSILASLILTPDLLADRKNPGQSTLLACALPVAICQGLQRYIPTVRIKYPNDIVAGGRKLGGILLEMCEGSLIVGFGINCLQKLTDLPPATRMPASSLFLETGEYLDREEILASILTEIDSILQKDTLDGITNRMNELCDTVGCGICLDLGDRVISGQAREICADGTLLIETENGVEKIYSSQVIRTWPVDQAMEGEGTGR